MGLGFNPFEDFVETEDDGPKKFIPAEKSEEEVDIDSKQYKEIKREIKRDHKGAYPEVIERLIRERLEEIGLEVELNN